MSKLFNWMTTKFWIRLFLSLIAIIVIQKCLGVSYISDTLVLGSMGFVVGLIGLHNQDKKIANRRHKNELQQYERIRKRFFEEIEL